MNAVQTICGHSFSEKSVKGWVEEHKSCPTCNHPLSLNDIVPNYGMRQAILAFSKYDLHQISKKGSKGPLSDSSNSDKDNKENNHQNINNDDNNNVNIDKENKDNNNNDKKEDNKGKEEEEEEKRKKEEEEEEEMFAGFSLHNSTKMIPLIQEKINNFNSEEANDELRSSMITELSLIKVSFSSPFFYYLLLLLLSLLSLFITIIIIIYITLIMIIMKDIAIRRMIIMIKK